MLYYEINIIWAWIELPLSLSPSLSFSIFYTFYNIFSNIIVKGIKLSKKKFSNIYLKLLKFCFKEKWKLDLKNIKVNKSKLLVF